MQSVVLEKMAVLATSYMAAINRVGENQFFANHQ